MNTLTRMLTAAGAALLLVTSAGTAQAFPEQAARVDAQIRPDFGGLITPPVRPRWRPVNPGVRPGTRVLPPIRRTESIQRVDCNNPPPPPYGNGAGQGGQGGYGGPPGGDGYGSGPQAPGRPQLSPIAEAMSRLVDGGTLYLAGTCKETIYIDRPIKIFGAGRSIFDEGQAAQATIAPLDGDPCISVASGTQGVEIHDLVLATEKGGRSACVQAFDAQVALVRTTVRYWGDSAAVYASGSDLILMESFVDARTWDAAVVVDGGKFRMTRTRVLSEEAGLDLTLSSHDSYIEQSGILGRDAALPAGNGIFLHGERGGSGALKVDNVVVCGWRNGVHLDRGSIAQITRSRICRNTVGVVSDGDLTLLESAINGREVGIYAATGRAAIKRNRIYGWTQVPLWIRDGVEPDVELNYAYYGDYCWRRSGWEKDVYCQSASSLSASIRDESQFTNPYRDWWEADAYDRGYARDGSPTVQPYPVPPKCIPPLVEVKGKCQAPKPPKPARPARR